MKRYLHFVRELIALILLNFSLAGCYTTNLNDVPELPEYFSYSLTPEQTAEVLSIIRRHSSYDLYIIPNIPDKKLVNAREASNVPTDEKILCLVNATVLDSAKNSLLVGLHGIYFRNGWNGDSPGRHFFSYVELQNVVIDISGWFEMSIGGVNFNMSACSMPRKKLISMLQEIQTVIKKNPPIQSSEFVQATEGGKLQVVQEMPENKNTENQSVDTKAAPVVIPSSDQNMVEEGIRSCEIRFEEAKSQHTLDAYKEFVKQYPKSDLAEQAKSLARPLFREAAIKDDSFPMYFEFLQWYQEGEDVEWARERAQVTMKPFCDKVADIVLNGWSRKLANAVHRSAGVTFIRQNGFETIGIEKALPPAAVQDVKLIAKLLRLGADPNTFGICGFKPAGTKEILEGKAELLSSGSPGSVVEMASAPAGTISLLEFARKNDLEEIVDLLKKHGGTSTDSSRAELSASLEAQFRAGTSPETAGRRSSSKSPVMFSYTKRMGPVQPDGTRKVEETFEFPNDSSDDQTLKYKSEKVESSEGQP